MTKLEKKSNFINWLQLVRLPNLFTVPGDILAGFALAIYFAQNSADCLNQTILAKLAALCAISISIYAAGLIDNDLRDLKKDKTYRADRPLPSGNISESTAGKVMVFLMLASISGAFLLARDLYNPTFRIAGGLIAAVLLYNRLKVKSKFLASALMGICRGANILLGATLLGWSGVLHASIFAGAVAVYIGIVTFVASFEHKSPGLPKIIGMLIRALIPIQILCVLATYSENSLTLSMLAVLLLCLLANILTSRKFKSS